MSGPRFEELHGIMDQTLAGWIQRGKRKSVASRSGLLSFVPAELHCALDGGL